MDRIGQCLEDAALYKSAIVSSLFGLSLEKKLRGSNASV